MCAQAAVEDNDNELTAYSIGRDIMYARELFYFESSGMAQHAACAM